MIDKQLYQIELQDLHDLCTSEISEYQTLEYKSKLELDKPKQKSEFLADLSSFANTMGGDLIIGIPESGGIPQGVIGFELDVPLDDFKLKIMNLLNTGLDPSPQCIRIKEIQVTKDNIVLIIRVKKAPGGPYRVSLSNVKASNQFYFRDDSGKRPAKTKDIGRLFRLFEFNNTPAYELILNNNETKFEQISQRLVELLKPLSRTECEILLKLNSLLIKRDNKLFMPILSNIQGTSDFLLEYLVVPYPNAKFISNNGTGRPVLLEKENINSQFSSNLNNLNSTVFVLHPSKDLEPCSYENLVFQTEHGFHTYPFCEGHGGSVFELENVTVSGTIQNKAWRDIWSNDSEPAYLEYEGFVRNFFTENEFTTIKELGIFEDRITKNERLNIYTAKLCNIGEELYQLMQRQPDLYLLKAIELRKKRPDPENYYGQY